jgi:hypothetical protein
MLPYFNGTARSEGHPNLDWREYRYEPTYSCKDVELWWKMQMTLDANGFVLPRLKIGHNPGSPGPEQFASQ